MCVPLGARVWSALLSPAAAPPTFEVFPSLPVPLPLGLPSLPPGSGWVARLTALPSPFPGG